jgi:hypothetical protein
MIDYTKLLSKLSPQPGGEDVLRLRVGIVDSVNADGTLDVGVSGLVIPDISRLDGPPVAVDDVVQILSYRGSLFVLGPRATTAPATPTGVTAFNTNNPTSTSTTYTSLTSTDVHGVAFVAPPSGAVEAVIQGWVACSSATVGRRVFLSQQLRAGNSVNSGTVIETADDTRAALSQTSIVTNFDYKYVNFHHVMSGLTPGSDYNLVSMVRVNTSGDTIAVNDRWMIIKEFA